MRKVRLGSTLVFAMAVLGSDLLSSLNLRMVTECVKINTAQWVKINVTLNRADTLRGNRDDFTPE